MQLVILTIICFVHKINSTHESSVDHDGFIPANLNPSAFHSPERPSVRTPEYTDFLKLLYNNDQKQKFHRDINNSRYKRALVFRPLFVYREQEIRKTKIKEQRKNMMAQRKAQEQKSVKNQG